MGVLKRGAALALCGLPLVACESPTAARETDRLTVETVDVRVAESVPVQVSAHVQGYLRDGCETLSGTSQTRERSTITVTIETERATDRQCVQVISPVEQDIMLTGEFSGGNTYLLRVNGVERTFFVD